MHDREQNTSVLAAPLMPLGRRHDALLQSNGHRSTAGIGITAGCKCECAAVTSLATYTKMDPRLHAWLRISSEA